MLETSTDLLNIVIAFCVLWFTVFLCWFIYYLVMIIKRVAETTEQIAKMSSAVNAFFDEAQQKLKNATSYAPLIYDGIKAGIQYLQQKNETSSSSTTKKKKKKKKSSKK